MKILRNIVDFFIYSNIWIALCAVAMCCASYIMLGLPIAYDALLVMVFMSTQATYSLARFMGMRGMSTEVQQLFWFGRHIWVLQVFFVLNLLGGIYCFLLLPTTVQFTLFAIGLLTLGYSLPLYKKNGEWVRLRDIDLLKIGIIVLSWGISTVVLPALNAELSLLDPQVICLFLERTLFIFAITLPFDIRDLKHDQTFSLKTIPGIIGVKKTRKLIAVLLLLLSGIAGIQSFFLGNYDRWGIFFALMVTYFFVLFLSSKTKETQADCFYTGWLDGLMILQFVLLFTFR